MQLKCLFWNSGRNSPNTEIAALALDTGANFIVLAEYPGTNTDLIREFSNVGLNFFAVPILGCQRLIIFTTFSISKIKHKREADRYTIKELTLPGKLPLLIGLVHLPSKLHSEDIDQLHSAIFFRQEIELAETEAKHNNTLIFGDFNMNPFDDGMMSAAAMNSLPCLVTAKKESRIKEGRSHSFFYNPSWNILGDFLGPPGTYFHSSPGYLSHYWNTLDQVILRPSIAARFIKQSLAVKTMAGQDSLINAAGRPTVSDHLPLYFELDLN